MVYRQFLFWKLDNLGSLCSSKSVRVRFTAFALLMWFFLALPTELVSKCQHITVCLHSVLLYGYCFSCLQTSFESISYYVNGFCLSPLLCSERSWKVFFWVFSAPELLESCPWSEGAVGNSLVNGHYCNWVTIQDKYNSLFFLVSRRLEYIWHYFHTEAVSSHKVNVGTDWTDDPKCRHLIYATGKIS